MPGPQRTPGQIDSLVRTSVRNQSAAAAAVRYAGLEREGIRYVFKLSSVEEVDAATIERQPLWNNRKSEHGPFDIVGDVHGCLDELLELLRGDLGYSVEMQDGQVTRRNRPKVES